MIVGHSSKMTKRGPRICFEVPFAQKWQKIPNGLPIAILLLTGKHCVLPACWPYPVVSHVSWGSAQCPLRMQTPPGRPPWSCDLWCMLRSQAPPVDRQVPVKTLPCPKLRLRVVKMYLALMALCTLSVHYILPETKFIRMVWFGATGNKLRNISIISISTFEIW